MPAPAKQTAGEVVATPKISDELAILQPEVAKVLPPHVGQEKFMRVVMTAVASSPQLARADRRSLLTSAIKCAQDGLLPDGREAAFAVYKTKVKVGNATRWIDKVQYLPMVYGILKKVRNSGELKALSCNVVYEHDDFRHWLDDAGEHITYEANLTAEDRGSLRAAFARAETKDGGIYIEVMTKLQIEQVRACSKWKDEGTWVHWYDEMSRKSVIRRLSKRLPMSTDLERTIRRDDELYDVRQVQRTERSGVEAARSMLGLNEALHTPPEEEEIEEGKQPQYTDESAAQFIAAAHTVDDLKSAWVAIANDYIETSRSIPIQLEAAYRDRLETLKQAAGNDG